MGTGGRCVTEGRRTGEEGEERGGAEGEREKEKGGRRERREGRKGGEEREGTGGLVAATLRYDSRLSYPPH